MCVLKYFIAFIYVYVLSCMCTCMGMYVRMCHGEHGAVWLGSGVGHQILTFGGYALSHFTNHILYMIIYIYIYIETRSYCVFQATLELTM